MASRRFEFHLLDRRNGHRAVKQITYSAQTDDDIFADVDWEWFDAGMYACCDHHRAHAMYGFGNTGPADLPELSRHIDGNELISVERVTDIDTGENWTDQTFPSSAPKAPARQFPTQGE